MLIYEQMKQHSHEDDPNPSERKRRSTFQEAPQALSIVALGLLRAYDKTPKIVSAPMTPLRQPFKSSELEALIDTAKIPVIDKLELLRTGERHVHSEHQSADTSMAPRSANQHVSQPSVHGRID